MDRIACRCGWIVNHGMDCDFCGIPGDEVVDYARAAAELRDVCGLPDTSGLREVAELRLA